jgi:hypothetical protein
MNNSNFVGKQGLANRTRLLGFFLLSQLSPPSWLVIRLGFFFLQSMAIDHFPLAASAAHTAFNRRD